MEFLLVSLLVCGVAWGFIHAYYMSGIITEALKGKTVTVYGRNVKHAKQCADDLLGTLRTIRNIQRVVPHSVVVGLHGLVMTIYFLAMTFSFPYQIFMVMVCKTKMQVREPK